MIDWYVVLTPLLLLPIVLLFVFVGCGKFGTSSSDPAGPPPPPPPTRIQLNPAANINVIVPGGTDYKVESIKVTWTLSKKPPSPGAPVPAPKNLVDSIVITDPARPFLDPQLDGSATRDLPAADVATYDQVRCDCRVTLRPTTLTDPDRDTFDTAAVTADLVAATNRVFRLDSNWDNPKAKPRRFRIIVQI